MLVPAAKELECHSKIRLTLHTAGAQNFSAMKNLGRGQKMVLPTPGELRLLQILWRIGGGTIEDIVKASGESPPPNYKTVQTLLRIMERKGQVTHLREGRAFVFRALVRQSHIHRLSIRELVTRYFTGSRRELMVELLRDERISGEELRQLENLIRNRR